MERGEARVLRADRAQLQWDMLDLDALLARDHRARLVWRFVETLDLRRFYDAIKAREGEAGRPPPDPAILVALWLYATLEGVGSAREVDRLTRRDVAYRWLCGGVPMNYHGLSDFRVGYGRLLDRLLSESVAALLAEGLVGLDEVAIDGTKVKAAAGKGSFVGADGLAKAERVAAERVAQLKSEIESDPAAGARRKRAAEERAAEELAARTAKARATLERLQAEKAERAKRHATEEKKKGGPKVSLTDPEARFMRFADGAVRPGYNMQVAATAQGLIVSVMESDRRNDGGLATPMVDDLRRRYGRVPQRILVDTTYATADDIAALADREQGAVLVYSPPPEEREDVKPASLRRRDAARAKEPETVKEWRRRMASPEGQAAYRRRKHIELVNAQLKNRGFGCLNLRGLAKARIVALWNALAHNILVIARLRLKTA